MDIGKLCRFALPAASAAVSLACLEPLAAAATNAEGTVLGDPPLGPSSGLLILVFFVVLGVTGMLLFFMPADVAARLARPMPRPSREGTRAPH